MTKDKKPKVIFATPALDKFTEPYIASLEASLPVIEAAGWDHGLVQEIGNVYISGARASLIRKAMTGEPDCIVFIDYDLSWKPDDLLRLLKADGDVVAGTYRFKTDDIEYMGTPNANADGIIPKRADGALLMRCVPAGFLKITRNGLRRFWKAHPELVYGDPWFQYIDLFNHGAMDGVWHGEDYGFSKRWTGLGGAIWCLPDMDITHHSADKAYPGNFHEWLMSQPGGSQDPARLKALEAMSNPEVVALLEQLKPKDIA
jgi:hypothetical protein